MKQDTKLYQGFFFFLLLFFMFSCKKDDLSEIKKGKYEMLIIRTFASGQIDTIRCLVYGPRILNNHYYFSPEIKDTLIDKIDIIISKRKKFVKGPFKLAKSWNIRFYSGNLPSLADFGGSVDSYDIQKSKLILNYSSKEINYGTLPQESPHTGRVEFNWMEV